MPSPLRNGNTRNNNHGNSDNHYYHHNQNNHFISSVSAQKLRRLNYLSLLLRFAAFCFSLTAAIFMLSDSSHSLSWTHFPYFRFVLAANAIIALYSFAEMGAVIWELLKGSTPLPESIQLWFDFSHDQVFAYLLLAAEAVAIGEARRLHGAGMCEEANGFCVQAYISVALGFAGFVFLALSALLSSYRVACHIITGARFHL